MVLNDAALVTPPIVMLDDPPTVNEIGTLRNCGEPLVTLTSNVALYTPFERPAGDVVSVICPGSLPEVVESFNYEVMVLLGDILAVQAG